MLGHMAPPFLKIFTPPRKSGRGKRLYDKTPALLQVSCWANTEIGKEKVSLFFTSRRTDSAHKRPRNDLGRVNHMTLKQASAS